MYFSLGITFPDNSGSDPGPRALKVQSLSPWALLDRFEGSGSARLDQARLRSAQGSEP